MNVPGGIIDRKNSNIIPEEQDSSEVSDTSSSGSSMGCDDEEDEEFLYRSIQKLNETSDN